MRHLYLQPLAVGNIKINYAFQSVSDIIIIGNKNSGKLAVVGHTPVVDPVYLDGKGHIGAGSVILYGSVVK